MFLATLILNGFVLGSILLLASLGLTLIYGVGRVVNFAHGALFSLGAMAAIWFTAIGFSYWGALLLTLITVGVLGVAIDWTLLARIRNRQMVDSLLLTFGIALLITGVLYESGGRDIHVLLPPEFLSGTASVFGIPLPEYRLFVMVFSIALTLILLIVLKKTRWGLRVRAANDNAEMAACLSIDRDALMRSVVGVSAALVAIAGAAAAPIFNAYAIVGNKILILAFMTVILGGLGSLKGAIVAAFIVGMVIVFGEAYSGGQGGLLILFILVMAMLLWWPRGFFGEGREE
ncbi:MAG: branched-chain amino acid ABC transporter permease [Candidimonas sp.]|nr:MAG: branched-chain amino acid ABC transporter permease [Candidimonas sp.]